MKAADPFDGYDLAGNQSIDAGCHGIVRGNLCAVCPHQPNPRPAHPARIRLRMEAPVQRIVVFPLALRAHGKRCHRGLRPVIRNAPRDGEARPAVGAVQKRIAIAPVLGVKELPQAIRARSRIRRNPGAHTAQHLAGNDPKTRISDKGQLAHRDRVDPRQRRRLGAQPGEKRLHTLLGPFDLNGQPIGIVADKPRQPLLQGQMIDKRTKPHPLHHSAYHECYASLQQRFVRFSFWWGFAGQVTASHRKPA